MTSAHLRCEAIAKSFGARTVLRDVDLEVAEGTLTAILGSSGSGKTTLLRVVVGFVAPDAGTVAIAGSIVAGGGRKPMAPDKRAIGYVAQEGALYPHLSVGENIGFGLPRGERKRGGRIIEMLDLVGLGRDYADRRPHELSGGEQRRVALARALAPRPRLVLLDEPFSGLDAALRGETRAAVLHALTQEGTTAVMVTHDQGEALSTGDEVAVLRGGELVQTASPDVLYRTPADLDVARFVGDAVVIGGHARGELVSCPLGTLEVLNPSLTGPVDVMVRPEQIVVSRAAPEPAGSPAVARARVVGHTCFGPDTVLALELEGSAPVALSARTFERDLPKPGEVVLLSVRGPVVAYPAGPPHASDAADRDNWVVVPAEEALAGSAHGGETRR
ncbi:MAG: ABC transporter ATP-binding protein [Solirubrobacteraceae bacterium]